MENGNGIEMELELLCLTNEYEYYGKGVETLVVRFMLVVCGVFFLFCWELIAKCEQKTTNQKIEIKDIKSVNVL